MPTQPTSARNAAKALSRVERAARPIMEARRLIRDHEAAYHEAVLAAVDALEAAGEPNAYARVASAAAGTTARDARPLATRQEIRQLVARRRKATTTPKP